MNLGPALGVQSLGSGTTREAPSSGFYYICNVHNSVIRNSEGFSYCISIFMDFLVAQMIRNLPANAGDPSSIPGSRRSPGEQNGYPLRCSYLENPMDRGAWQATVPGFAKTHTQLTLSLFNLSIFYILSLLPWLGPLLPC